MFHVTYFQRVIIVKIRYHTLRFEPKLSKYNSVRIVKDDNMK